MESEWLVGSDAAAFWKIAWFAAPFMALVAATIAYFLLTA
jgi:hypothetical protein